jgi:FkbM family methyltransferase
MSIPAKAATALRLLLSGDLAAFRRQVRINLAARRLRRAAGRAFIYRDFGFPMVCHPDWPDSAACLNGEDYDEWETRLIRQWLAPGETAIDFGANLGVYTFACAAAVGRTGRVFSVDADAYVVEKLRLGAELLAAPQVHPVHRAMTAENGTVTFYVRANRTDTGGQSLRPEEAERQACTPVTVPASTVPHLLGELGFTGIPSLVKADIEGAEAMLLATVPAEWFTTAGPFWILEINPYTLRHFNAVPRDLTERFPATAFDRWLLTKHPLDPAQPPQLRRLESGEAFADARYYNFFAVPRDPARAGRAAGLARYLRDTR